MSFNITPVASGYQEIHPYSAMNIDSVKINTSLIMMKEWEIHPLRPQDFPRTSRTSRVSGNLSGVGDGFPNTSLVLVEHGYNLEICSSFIFLCIFFIIFTSIFIKLIIIYLYYICFHFIYYIYLSTLVQVMIELAFRLAFGVHLWFVFIALQKNSLHLFSTFPQFLLLRDSCVPYTFQGYHSRKIVLNFHIEDDLVIAANWIWLILEILVTRYRTFIWK